MATGSDAQSTIRVMVNTTADTSGLDQTTVGLEKVDAAQKQASAGVAAWTSATQAGAVGMAKMGAEAGTAAASTDTLSVAIAKLEKEAPAAAAAVKRLQSGVEQMSTQKKKATKDTDDATESIKKYSTGAVNSGQAMLTLGRGIQDLQFGILGVLNNIEALVMALGGTAGLAGVLTMVGVGISILLPYLKGLGDNSAEVAEKQRELAKAADAAADAAENEAEIFNEARASFAAHQASVEGLAAQYKSLSEAIANAIRLREQQRRLDIAETDAEAGLGLAQVDSDEAAGRISKQEAERKRNQITGEAARRNFGRQQEGKEEREAQMRAEAAIAKADAETIARKAKEQAAKGEGLMNEPDRKAAQKRAEDAAGDMLILGRRIVILEEQLGALTRTEEERRSRGESVSNLPDMRAAKDAEIIAVREEMLAQIAAKQKAEARLAADQAAHQRTGLPDKAALEAEQKKAEEQAKAKRDAAAKMEIDANASEQGRASERRTFETQQRTRDLRSGTRVGEMDKAEKDKAEKEAERLAREAERAQKEHEQQQLRKLDAERRVAEAEIKKRQASGQMTDEQAAAAMGGVRSKYFTDRSGLTAKNDDEEGKLRSRAEQLEAEADAIREREQARQKAEREAEKSEARQERRDGARPGGRRARRRGAWGMGYDGADEDGRRTMEYRNGDAAGRLDSRIPGGGTGGGMGFGLPDLSEGGGGISGPLKDYLQAAGDERSAQGDLQALLVAQTKAARESAKKAAAMANDVRSGR